LLGLAPDPELGCAPPCPLDAASALTVQPTVLAMVLPAPVVKLPPAPPSAAASPPINPSGMQLELVSAEKTRAVPA
jgi:hypothetical protein